MISKHKIIKSSSPQFKITISMSNAAHHHSSLSLSQQPHSFWDEDIYAHINYWQFTVLKRIFISKAAS
jgi:hypothetical protein